MSACAVVIVSYNTRDHLRACLDSVLAEAPAEIVVADNGSSDGSVEMVREIYPTVRLLVDSSNPGYGAAANRGVAATAADAVLILNSDTILRPDSIAALSAHLAAHARAALVGPRLTNPDGSLQPSCYPFLGTFRLALEKSPLAGLLARRRRLRENYLLLHSGHDRPRVVPWVLGAALAVRRAAFDAVGGFDEAFFMYGEEVDLCYRLAAEGWEVHFTPEAEVVHVGGASTRRERVAMESKRSASAVQFYRRHYSPARVALLVALIKAAAAFRLGRDTVRLRLAGDAGARARLAEDLALWRSALTGWR